MEKDVFVYFSSQKDAKNEIKKNIELLRCQILKKEVHFLC